MGGVKAMGDGAPHPPNLGLKAIQNAVNAGKFSFLGKTGHSMYKKKGVGKVWFRQVSILFSCSEFMAQEMMFPSPQVDRLLFDGIPSLDLKFKEETKPISMRSNMKQVSSSSSIFSDTSNGLSTMWSYSGWTSSDMAHTMPSCHHHPFACISHAPPSSRISAR